MRAKPRRFTLKLLRDNALVTPNKQDDAGDGGTSDEPKAGVADQGQNTDFPAGAHWEFQMKRPTTGGKMFDGWEYAVYLSNDGRSIKQIVIHGIGFDAAPDRVVMPGNPYQSDYLNRRSTTEIADVAIDPEQGDWTRLTFGLVWTFGQTNGELRLPTSFTMSRAVGAATADVLFARTMVELATPGLEPQTETESAIATFVPQ
jgi:hypothetical protein